MVWSSKIKFKSWVWSNNRFLRYLTFCRFQCRWLGGWDVPELMWDVPELMWRLSDYSTTLWPILQAETCQIFSWAEIPRWSECGNMSTIVLQIQSLVWHLLGIDWPPGLLAWHCQVAATSVKTERQQDGDRRTGVQDDCSSVILSSCLPVFLPCAW